MHQEQVKKANCFKNCTDFSLFEEIVLVISKNICRTLEQFFLTVGQNNFGNKTPFLTFSAFSKYQLLNSNCSIVLNMRNLQVHNLDKSSISKIVVVISKLMQVIGLASNFKSFSRSLALEHFFLTEGQNNFGNKIPISKIVLTFHCSNELLSF